MHEWYVPEEDANNYPQGLATPARVIAELDVPQRPRPSGPEPKFEPVSQTPLGRRLLNQAIVLAAAAVLGAAAVTALLPGVPFAALAGAVAGVVAASLFLGGNYLQPVFYGVALGLAVGFKLGDTLTLWACIALGVAAGLVVGLVLEVRMAGRQNNGAIPHHPQGT
jgi:hypothetical protein